MGKVFKTDEYKGVLKVNGQYPDSAGNITVARDTGDIGRIGSHVMAGHKRNTAVGLGEVLAGAELNVSGFGRLAGAWKCLGHAEAGVTTLWIRVPQEVESASNPVWANSAQTQINLMVKFKHMDQAVPLTADKQDIEEQGKQLFNSTVFGMYGSIAPYTA